MGRIRSAAWLGILAIATVGGCSPPLPPLNIGPASLSDGVEGSPYAQQLVTDRDDDIAWRIIAGELPPGLTLGSKTGLISGTAAAPGNYTFTVRAVRDAFPRDQEGEATYTIHIIQRLELRIELPTARVGQPYAGALTVSGGVKPYDLRLVGLKAGLSFDPATGAISGTPLLPDTLELDISVTDSGGDLQQQITARRSLAIKPPNVRFVTEALGGGIVDEPYSDRVLAADGRPPYRFAVVAGVLPEGLTLSVSTGVISGTPTAAGSSQFQVEVADSDSPATTAIATFTITIEPRPAQ